MEDHPDDCTCSSCEDADDLDRPEPDEPEPPDAGGPLSLGEQYQKAWQDKFGYRGTHRR